MYISSGKKLITGKLGPSSASASSEVIFGITTIEAEASSCLSCTSSAQTFSSKIDADGDNPRNPEIQGQMGHKTAAVLRVFSNGSASEVMIQKLFGDSPSMSKALRMLLKLQEVKRYGAGGRSDHFIYTEATGQYSVIFDWARDEKRVGQAPMGRRDSPRSEMMPLNKHDAHLMKLSNSKRWVCCSNFKNVDSWFYF